MTKKIRSLLHKLICLFLCLSFACLTMQPYAEAAADVTFTVVWPDAARINATEVVLTGVAQSNMNILINGDQVIPSRNPFSTALIDWEYTVPLADEGENEFVIQSQESIFKKIVAEERNTLFRDTTPPEKPQILNWPTQTLSATQYELVGTKEADTEVIINGNTVIPVNSSTTWTATVNLTVEGKNTFSISLRDTATPPHESIVVNGNMYRDTIAPAMPEVTNLPSGSVVDGTYTLTGTKDTNTSVWINNTLAVGTTNATTWTHTVTLTEGANRFQIQSRDTATPENVSDTRDITITRTQGEVPAPTVVWPTSRVNAIYCNLHGTKAAYTSVWINDVQKIATNSSTTWGADVMLSAEAANTFTIYVKDDSHPARASAAVIGTIVRDMTAPSTPVVLNWPTTPVSTTRYTLSGLKEPGSSIRLNGAEVVSPTAGENWSYEYTLSEGTNTIRIISQDTAQPANESSAVVGTIVRKTDSLALPTASFPTAYLNASTYTLQGTKPAYSSLWINGVQRVPYAATTTWQVDVVLTQEGTNTFSVMARDNAVPANTSGTVTGTIMRDMIAPSRPFVDNWPTDTVTTATYTLVGDKDAYSSIMINDQEVIPTNDSTRWEYTVSLQEGENIISVRSCDTAQPANISQQNFSRIIKTTQEVPAPYVSWPSDRMNATTYMLTGTRARNASIWINGAQAVGATDSRTWEASVPLAQEGVNNFIVTARDTASPMNESAAVSGVVIRDMTPPAQPIVTNVPSGDVVSTSYTLEGTKDAGSSVWINDTEAVPVNADTVWSYTVLLGRGDNTFAIYSCDDAVMPNHSTTLSVVITTPTTVPAITVTNWDSVLVNTMAYTLRGTKSADTAVYVNDVLAVEKNAQTQWMYSVPLDQEGPKSISVYAVRADGMKSSVLTGQIIRDRTPPGGILEGPTAGYTTDSNAVRVYGTVSDQYGIASVTVNGISTSFDNDIFDTTIDLVPGQNTVQVTVKDHAGNSRMWQVKVYYMFDTPTNLTALQTFHGVEVVWQDNSQREEGYRIYRKTGWDGTYNLLMTLPANTTSYIDKNIQKRTVYVYYVKAFYGNEASAPSNECHNVDATPPVLNITSPEPKTIVSCNGFTVTGTAIDASGVEDVACEVQDTYNGHASCCIVDLDDDGNWNAFVAPSSFTPDYIINFWVTARDFWGNILRKDRVTYRIERNVGAVNTIVSIVPEHKAVVWVGEDNSIQVTVSNPDMAGLTYVLSINEEIVQEESETNILTIPAAYVPEIGKCHFDIMLQEEAGTMLNKKTYYYNVFRRPILPPDIEDSNDLNLFMKARSLVRFFQSLYTAGD